MCCTGDPVKAATVFLTPGQNRLKDCIPILPTIVQTRTAHFKIVAHVKDPMSTHLVRESLTACGMAAHR